MSVLLDGIARYGCLWELRMSLDPRLHEVVHHEDEDNKQNNDPANLIVFPDQGAHARHHRLRHLGQPSCDCGGIRLKEVMPL